MHNNQKELCANLDCDDCFKRSFASHPKSICWSPRNEVLPRFVFKSSGKKFWFKCNVCPHEFDSKLGNVNNGKFCPYCANQRLCDDPECEFCYNRSFASCPKSNCWSSKNNVLPRFIFKGSGKKFWFNCDVCPHEFDIILYNVVKGSFCPYCSNVKLCDDVNCEICFNKSFASHPKSICWSPRNEVLPRFVFKSSNKKYWIKCDACPHEFNSIICNISQGHFCPYCSGKKLCDDANCEFCFNKSFSSNFYSKYWSKINVLKPRNVTKGSQRKFWFDCPGCGHSFEQSLDHISGKDIKFCAYCAHRKLCDDVDCEFCYNNSFDSHPKSYEWSIRNHIIPRALFKNSITKFWFDCYKCFHEYQQSLNDITQGHGCMFCTNQKLCDDINCEICFDKSFASHPRSKNLSPKDKQNPRNLFLGTDKKCIFVCEKGHEFSASVCSITNDTWCPDCVNKTEAKLAERLLIEGYEFVREVKFPWCINEDTGRQLRFDFLISDLNLLIEVDGRQHFEQISNWTSPEDTQILDKFKMDAAVNNGYTIIRILQEDIWFDRLDWFGLLKPHLKLHAEPIRIYLYDKTVYKHLVEDSS
jgi:very-short-patch-repair endonuclease